MVDEDIKKKTVLLLLGDEDRAIFKEILSPYYEIAVPEKNDLPEEGFDLCILDYPNFKRHERAISKLKQSAGPVIVPFVLVMDRGELSKVSPDGPYDEVILRPVERTEALKRVSALLKTKELSLNITRIFDFIPDALCVLDSEGNILRYNRALQRFSGTDEDLRGRKCYEVMCKDEFLNGNCPLAIAMKSGRKEGKELMIGDRWFYAIVYPVGNKDNRVYFHVLHDITERKLINQKMIESEAFYRAIFENTGTATIIVNSDGTIAAANRECFRMTGYSPEQLIGTHWQNYVSEESLPMMKEYFSLRFTNPEKAPTRYEAKLVDAKGRVRNAILQIGLIEHTKQIVVSMLDITEQRQLEAQLLQAQKLESIGRLAGGVAHDFNNMLNVIIGYAEMGLNKVTEDSPLHKYFTNILTAARRSAETTNRLLGFARKQMISPKVLDLNRTIENMLDMLKRLIGENIELLWAPGLNLWKVKMDPDQVSQILVNLLVNAKDAIEGQGKVIIETENVKIDEQYCQTHAEALPGKFVRLSVTDTGCGMPEEVLEHIFEPFFTTKDVGKGTGLGLATVYGIVKQNNGFINVYSEVGKGTTFKIYLPKYGNDTEEEEETLQRPYTVPYGKGETVLVVEDEPDVLGITKDMLEAINYKVITAKKPSEALKLLEEHKGALDLVLTDVVMPEMSGKELLLKLRERFPDLKALFMSGYTENAIIHNGVLDRGEKLIQKPFTLRELATKVRQVLEGSSDIS